MTIALAVLATYWLCLTMDEIVPYMPTWLTYILVPAIAAGMLAAPQGFLLPLAAATVVKWLHKLVTLTAPRVQSTVQRTRRGAVPPLR